MSQKPNLKICLVGECLSGGGAEKAMALLSNFFTSQGIETYTVIVVDSVVYEYSGQLLNLGKLKNNSNGFFNKLNRFFALRKFLRLNSFDYMIDFRVRVSFLQEYITAKFLYDAPTVYTVHSTMTELYFPKSKWKSRAIYSDAFAVACVSKALESKINELYGLENTLTIYNPIDSNQIQKSATSFIPEETNYILAAGRMKDDIKQFDKLIATYAKTSLPGKKINLIILGDGQTREKLERQVFDLNLQSQIIFKGQVENPFPYMKNALFLVLSSRREGLPTVILESLACGTPVVSFDCVSGPAEMISDRENGLLVANQDFGKLAESMESMVSDADLYNRCKANAKPSVEPFSLENIGQQWLAMLKID